MISFLMITDFSGIVQEIKWCSPVYLIPRVGTALFDLFLDQEKESLAKVLTASKAVESYQWDTPLCLRSSPEKVRLCARSAGEMILMLAIDEKICTLNQPNQPLNEMLIRLLGEVPIPTQGQPALNTEEARFQFEQIQLINNELINTKRMLAKVNATLERRVHERTAELKVANQALESALHVKEQFLGAMSHELRTPLNTMLGYTQILLSAQGLAGTEREYLETIQHSGEHLLGLINDTLEMTKINTGQVSFNPAPFNLPRLLSELEGQFRPRMEAKGLRLAFELEVGIPEIILSDEPKIKEILAQLLGNGLKFTRKGGVTLRCRADPNPAGSDAQDQLLRIEVEDSGVGIAPENLPRLFKAYEQIGSSAPRSGGTGFTGLGLAISQSYASLMGGEIKVASLPGVGSRFQVWLPVRRGVGEAQGAAAQASTGGPAPAALMAAIPPDLVGQMRVATINGHFFELLALIDAAAVHAPQAADHLRRLANAFEYDVLLELFNQG
jgi:signal transduction histidine kinase